MTSGNFTQTAAFLWSVADLLRGDFKQSQYGRIILPFTLLRRLECVLEDSKEAVLAQAEKIKALNLPEEAQEKMLLRAADGLTFFNTSPMDLSKMGQNASKPTWKSTFNPFQPMPVRFSTTSSSTSLWVNWKRPTCCIKWYKSSRMQI